MTDPLDSLPKVGTPATRALQAAGFHSLRQLAGVSREELGNLHGIGPRALSILDAELARVGLALAPAAADEPGSVDGGHR